MKNNNKNKLISLAVQIIAVLALGTLLIILSGADPIRAMRSFLFGITGSINGVAEILVKATPLIFLGLGTSVAFRTGYFNIGAEGQLYMGALAASAVVLRFTGVPGILRVIIAIVSAFIAGGIWALIPALMKNKMNIAESISTIMFNYIAIMIVGIAIRGSLQDVETMLPQTAKIPAECTLPVLLQPTRLHLGFVFALMAVVIVWFMLYKTSVGYEMQASGLNQRAARCNGIPVEKSLVFSAILSGGLAGLAGMSEVLGVQLRLLEGISGGNGYTAILIALLAGNNPVGVLIVSLLYATIQVGANTMQRQLGVPSSIVSILVGFIVIMVLCRELFSRIGGSVNKKKEAE